MDMIGRRENGRVEGVFVVYVCRRPSGCLLSRIRK
jgi:hypothetical protein